MQKLLYDEKQPAKIEPMEITQQMDKTSSISEEAVLYSWESAVRVLSNPSAWSGVSLSLGAGAIGLGILFTIISKSIKGLYLGAGLFGGLMLIFVIVGGIIDIFGGFRVNFMQGSTHRCKSSYCRRDPYR
jgi:hypothetical protein